MGRRASDSATRPPSRVRRLWLMRMPATGSLHPMRGDTSGMVWHMDQPGVSPAGVPGASARLLTPASISAWLTQGSPGA